MGETVTVEVIADSVSVVYDGKGSIAPAGTVLASGLLMKHKSGVWIVGSTPEEAQLDEVGGCSGGPEVIDFEQLLFWWC